MKRVAAGVVLAVALCAARPAQADDLEVDRTQTAIVVGVGGLVYLLSENVFKDELAPESCRWCDGDGLNGLDASVRDALKFDDIGVAETISDVGLSFTPVAALGLLGLAAYRQDVISNWDDDALVVLEAAVLSNLLNQSVKMLFGRERPFVRALPADQKGMSEHPEDENLSFYSGHASFTMSVAVAAGTVASMRGYREAPWIWGVGVTLSLGTGMLRIGADKHYFTDVMTGAALGALVGWAVPRYLHRRKGGGETRVIGTPTPGGAMLGVHGVW